MNTVEVNLRKRNSSIELLRIIAMVTIVYFHFHARDFSLYVLGNERIQEKGLFFHAVLHHLGMLGVPCFMFVSGYYGIKFRENRFVDITFQCLFYALLTIAGCYAFGEYPNMQQLFFFNNWWFILAYVVIYMLSSGLNHIIEILSAKKMLIMIILFYFMMIGAMFNKAATTNGLMTLLAIYFMARWIKIYLNERQKTYLIFIAIGLLIVKFLGIIVAFKTTHLGLLPYLSSYDNPMNIVCVGGMIMAVERFYFSSRIINYFANSTLAVYLLSESQIGQTIFKKLFVTYEGVHYSIVYFTASLIIFLICVGVDKVRILLTANIMYRLTINKNK